VTSKRRTARLPPATTPPVAAAPGATDGRDNLGHLYTISKHLMRFHDVAGTVPRVLEVVNQDVPLRTAILLEEIDRSTLWACLWHASGVGESELASAEANAKAVYSHLSGGEPDALAKIAFQHVRLDALTARRLAADPARSFVVLPLVNESLAIFGVLLVESVRELSEPDLSFVNAAANQLAVALDRHRSLGREVALRERAESLERAEKEALAKAQVARAEAEAARNRLGFLSDVSATLASSLDYGETLSRLAHLAVPALGEWCAVDMIEGERLVRPGAAHRDPRLEPLVRELGRYHNASVPHGASLVTRTGQPELVAAITPAFAAELEPYPRFHEALRQLRLTSFVAVPLVGHGGVLGSITVGRTDAQPAFDAEDLALARELCGRAAVAVENARLYAASRNAVRARDQFLAVVSHDLRNPLGAIDLTVSLMLRSLPATDAKTRKRAENIRRSVHRMNRLIDDLLDMASIDANRLAIDAKATDVSGILAETHDTFAEIAAEKRLRFDCRIAPAVHEARCDRGRILQVLSNLVGNAVKFTSEGGAITLAAEREPGAVHVSVTDTGRGMSKEEVAHAFERFWQVQTVGRSGIGLGLFIARGIVEAHGGRIWVESEPGKGTSFFFTLPVPDAPPSL
jgi:signal transduction histidine kinase